MTAFTDPATTLNLTRTFTAGRDRVYRAWTDPDALAVWWWPWSPTVAINAQPGGAYRFTADVPGLGPLAVSGMFHAVEPPEHLRYTFTFDGEAQTTVVDVTFAAHDDRTDVVLQHTGFADQEERDNNRDGWISCLDRLDAMLGNGDDRAKEEAGAPTQPSPVVGNDHEATD